MRNILIFLTLLYSATLGAQSYTDLILENPERAASVHHVYEYRPAAETPAPRGYKPFYMSHYGRHGSRRATAKSAEAAYEFMSSAHRESILTPKGEELYRMVYAIHLDHEDMLGELTPLGAREHREIAERAYKRFPKLWRSRKRTQVHVQSSNYSRCLASMANFTSALDDMAPRLVFDFATGGRYLNLLAHDFYKSDEVFNEGRSLRDSLLKAYLKPERFIGEIFRDTPLKVAPDSLQLIFQIYSYGGIRQCTETRDADILGTFFTIDEIIALYRSYNSYIYSVLANSTEHGRQIRWAARDLLKDIIARADDAISKSSRTAADLRFGHDTGILPLASLMDLEGVADSFPAASASESGWQSFFNVPMATNLQIVFYRKRSREPLVKILFNERETRIRGLEGGPYYKWSELRAYFVKRIGEADI